MTQLSTDTNGTTGNKPAPKKIDAKEQARQEAERNAKIRAALGPDVSDEDFNAILAQAAATVNQKKQAQKEQAQLEASSRLRSLLYTPSQGLTFIGLMAELETISQAFGGQDSDVNAALSISAKAVKPGRKPADPNAPKKESAPSQERTLTDEDKKNIEAHVASTTGAFKTGDVAKACNTTSKNTGIFLSKMLAAGKLTSQGERAMKSFTKV